MFFFFGFLETDLEKPPGSTLTHKFLQVSHKAIWPGWIRAPLQLESGPPDSCTEKTYGSLGGWRSGGFGTQRGGFNELY